MTNYKNKIVFVATYYNNPKFIELQLKCFQTFVEDDFDFIVMDDSDYDTKSLATGELASPEIEKECKKFNIRYVRVPQNIHNNILNGGLVPDSLPANHPTERHRACLHWIFKNNKKLGLDQYNIFALIESDLFIKNKINIIKYMEGYDLVGPGRKGVKLIKENNGYQYWPEEIKDLNEITIDFFPMYMLLINMKNVKNIETIDIGGFAGTDTGGKTGLWLKNNDYKYLFLGIGHDKLYQVDFFAKENYISNGYLPRIEYSDDNSEFIHYRAGSNWDYQSLNYYNEKLRRMFIRYIPNIDVNIPQSKDNLKSRDGEHVFLKDGSAEIIKKDK